MNWFKKRQYRFFTKLYSNKILYRYGCEINPGATIDKSVKFIHIVGVVIGGYAVIKKNVRIYQHITLGAQLGIDGKGDKTKMPTIENNVTIYAGAVITGGIIIGENSIIAANSIVTKDVPANSLVTGINKIKKLDN